ncbi:hypothetical protein LL912_00725 [Niabella sp. CC-SYL272]|uniref:hypothetical protein n=1 Tax=Niabella agricola TaxID=2891571 RepID=UPI001F37E910|nr:hypothetical protein [Niabella agricola]MCF3107290.1 hypothetical protein [Niabella agricola]
MSRIREKRFKAIKRGENTWIVYDENRGAAITKSVSPNASYNKEVAEVIADLLNNQDEIGSYAIKKISQQ